jgi:hypothetical protein
VVVYCTYFKEKDGDDAFIYEEAAHTFGDLLVLLLA